MTIASRYIAAAAVIGTGLALAPGVPRPSGLSAQASGLTVPPGFEVERVAGPPLVQRPIVADFDEQGRLYVADSSGSNDRTEKQLEDRPHRIVRLEDTNGDGRFDASVVFADRMMLPEGTMWLDGSLYVAAPPSIWKLTDTDGDGVADRREEWFQGKTLTGCANDLHGPYLGPDGWIYWTKGAFAEQTYERPGAAPLVTKASHIFRRRPGSRDVDVVMTGGMDNPVDVAFTAGGERILTATFVEHPQLGRRDGLLHAIYGGVYGKPHAVLDGHTRTGDLMPVMAHLGPAVPSGLTRYASAIFGPEYRDSFFAAMFNVRKVTRFVLEPSGASFEAKTSDFLVSDDRDFHPTDVLEDADGSLLVIDTGPWYKLCCPTSQLAKPDLPGAIYRVRRTGARGPRDPRGTRIAWDRMPAADLARLLEDGRIAVQQRAIHLLGKRAGGAEDVLTRVLQTAPSADVRRNAVWALTRIETTQARQAVHLAMADRDLTVRQAAIHSAGLWRDRSALAELLQALGSGDAAVRRAAAEALGRIGDASAVPPLLAAVPPGGDRVLEHSLTYALVEIGDRAATGAGLQGAAPHAKRAALIALDQMGGGAIGPEGVIPLLTSSDALLADTAWWIASRHPEWGGALAGFFRSRLAAGGESEDLPEKLAQFSSAPEIQALLAETVASARRAAARRTALLAMAAARVKTLPRAWADALAAALRDPDPSIAGDAVAAVRTLPKAASVPGIRTALLENARRGARPLDLRVESLAAVGEDLPELAPDLLELLCLGLEPARPVAIRLTAAGVLERARLSQPQLARVAQLVETAGPLELPRLLGTFHGGAADAATGAALLDALERSPAAATVRPELLRSTLAQYPETVRARADALISRLHVDTSKQAEHLERLLAELGTGDIRKGQEIFNSEKTACASCHAIGYMGGTLGPDLTRIGEVRAERDLLEAIVFPSASFARGYEPMTVTTRRGGVLSGVVRSERADEVVLATAAQEELRIPRGEIADMQPGVVSPMPPGLDEQLTREELADLMAFLKATRRGAN